MLVPEGTEWAPLPLRHPALASGPIPLRSCSDPLPKCAACQWYTIQCLQPNELQTRQYFNAQVHKLTLDFQQSCQGGAVSTSTLQLGELRQGDQTSLHAGGHGQCGSGVQLRGALPACRPPHHAPRRRSEHTEGLVRDRTSSW